MTPSDRVNAWQKAKSRNSRDIGELPWPAHPLERAWAKYDLKFYIERYHPEKVTLGWCKDHLTLLREIEHALLDTAQQVTAMPRGSGKTTLMRLGVEWAVIYGHRRWPLLISAENELFKKQMRAFAVTFRSKPLLGADFPETIGVIQKMETAQAAVNMLCCGENMQLVWKTDEIVLPTNYMTRDLKTGGAVICGGGITGSVRGAQYTLPSGEIIRPDAVLVDDFQTRESANSIKQTHDRLETIASDLMGCAGPGKRMSAMIACTVIVKNDAADRLLSDEFPEWRSIRTSWIKKWPTEMYLWHQYGSMLRQCKLDKRDTAECHEYYRRYRHGIYGLGWKRPGMDAGAETYWPDRKGNHLVPKALSSLETGMAWHLLNPITFASEGQNYPIDPFTPDDVVYCTSKEIRAKTAPLPRMHLPDDTVHLVAHVDVQLECVIYTIMAFCEPFYGHVVDYGVWPDQDVTYWTKRQLQSKLSQINQDNDAAWLHALRYVQQEIEEYPWLRNDGSSVHLSLGLVDGSTGAGSKEIVYRFCREYGEGRWFPAIGRGITPTMNQLNENAKRKPKERFGPHWNRKPDPNRHIDRFMFDANFWKTQVHKMWRAPVGSEACLTLCEGDHQLFADHQCGEFPKLLKNATDSREGVVWIEKVNSDQDHFDNVVACLVAASHCGLVLPGHEAHHQAPKRKRRKLTGAMIRSRRR